MNRGAIVLLLVMATLPSCMTAALAGDSGYTLFQRAPDDYVYRSELPAAVESGPGFNPISSMRRQRLAMRAAAGREEGAPSPLEPGLAELVREMAGQLLASVGAAGGERVVALSSFVNLNNLYKTSSLGRFLSEQLMGELQRAGLQVIDVRKTPGMMISQGYGEYSLSRDMGELSYVHQVDGMVVGTYSFSDQRLFLNVRLLDGEDGMVLGSASIDTAMGPTIAQFLADEAVPVPAGKPVAVRELEE